jgi:hypothetical protein
MRPYGNVSFFMLYFSYIGGMYGKIYSAFTGCECRREKYNINAGAEKVL